VSSAFTPGIVIWDRTSAVVGDLQALFDIGLFREAPLTGIPIDSRPRYPSLISVTPCSSAILQSMQLSFSSPTIGVSGKRNHCFF
jgi:hypothetical protein